jgi:hypothetical protein
MEYRASLTAAERELEPVEVRRQKLIEMVMQGVPASEVRDEMTGNAARREELKAKLAAAAEPPTLLHPSMAQLYGENVDGLVQASMRAGRARALNNLRTESPQLVSARWAGVARPCCRPARLLWCSSSPGSVGVGVAENEGSTPCP